MNLPNTLWDINYKKGKGQFVSIDIDDIISLENRAAFHDLSRRISITLKRNFLNLIKINLSYSNLAKQKTHETDQIIGSMPDFQSLGQFWFLLISTYKSFFKAIIEFSISKKLLTFHYCLYIITCSSCFISNNSILCASKIICARVETP